MTSEAESNQRSELNIRVIPNASRDEIIGWHAGALKVKVATQPELGKANKAVCALLAKHLRLPKRAVTVVRGGTTQMKQLEIIGVNSEALKRIL